MFNEETRKFYNKVRDSFTTYYKNLNARNNNDYYVLQNLLNALPPEDDYSTLFCSSGMQAYRDRFVKPVNGIEIGSSCQRCIRLNDLDNLGKTYHHLAFNMLGLFSWTEKVGMKAVINVWLQVLKDLKLPLSKITIHPDKLTEWTDFYPKELHSLIVADDTCTWSDNTDLAGYCTEFYSKDIEIGNIVNISGKYVDSGFGLERMYYASLEKPELPKRLKLIFDAVTTMTYMGVRSAPQDQGYELRKLLRELVKAGIDTVEKISACGVTSDVHYLLGVITEEAERQEKLKVKYNKLKDKASAQNQTAEWWYSTHGIVIEDMLVSV